MCQALTRKPEAVKVWSLALCTASVVQVALMLAMAAATGSGAIIICLLLSIGILVTNALYAFRLLKLTKGLPLVQWRPFFFSRWKFVHVVFVLIGAWVFWIAFMTYVFRRSDVKMWSHLKDLDKGARNLCILLMITVFLCIGVDCVLVVHHARAVREGQHYSDRRLKLVGLAVVLDAVMLILAILSAVHSKNSGSVVALVLQLFSLGLRVRYAKHAKMQSFLAEGWHSNAGLETLQHIFVSTTVALVNVMVLYAESVSNGFWKLIEELSGGARFVAFSTIIIHLVLLFIVLLLIRFHGIIEIMAIGTGHQTLPGPAGPTDAYVVPPPRAAAVPPPNYGAGGSGGAAAAAATALPVPPPTAVAVPPPLTGTATAVPPPSSAWDQA